MSTVVLKWEPQNVPLGKNWHVTCDLWRGVNEQDALTIVADVVAKLKLTSQDFQAAFADVAAQGPIAYFQERAARTTAGRNDPSFTNYHNDGSVTGKLGSVSCAILVSCPGVAQLRGELDTRNLSKSRDHNTRKGMYIPHMSIEAQDRAHLVSQPVTGGRLVLKVLGGKRLGVWPLTAPVPPVAAPAQAAGSSSSGGGGSSGSSGGTSTSGPAPKKQKPNPTAAGASGGGGTRLSGGGGLLAAAATYAFDTFYCHPYPRPPKDKEHIQDYWQDWEPEFKGDASLAVQRPNHGIANALRKATLMPKVVAAYRQANPAAFPDGFDFSPGMQEAMQLTLLFATCGRESDISGSTDPDAYRAYRKASRDAFDSYATGRIADDLRNCCTAALESMFRKTHSSSVARVFEVCHELDLFRCVDNLATKIARIKSELPTTAAESLMRLAEDQIRSTGDRLLFSPTGRGTRDDRDRTLFSRCSRQPDKCLQALEALASPAISLPPPGPHVVGEADTRFIRSRYKVLYASQKTAWDHTNWDRKAIDGQRAELLSTVSTLALAYCDEHSIDRTTGEAFVQDLRKNANKEKQMELLAVSLWKSDVELEPTHRIELCSMINEAIRLDGSSPNGKTPADATSPMLQPAVTLSCMLSRHLGASRRNSSGPFQGHILWPQGSKAGWTKGKSTEPNTTFRGSSIPSSTYNLDFFHALSGTGQKYRAPMLLASSFMKDTTEDFMRNSPGREKVLFIIKLPLSCYHVNYVDRNSSAATIQRSEKEFLFSAYSVFTVESVHPSSAPPQLYATYEHPHVITILASKDNATEHADLPSAPWH